MIGCLMLYVVLVPFVVVPATLNIIVIALSEFVGIARMGGGAPLEEPIGAHPFWRPLFVEAPSSSPWSTMAHVRLPKGGVEVAPMRAREAD